MQNLNILIPLDFSAVSEQAFLMADILAKKIPVNIHLLHVIEANHTIIADNPDLSEAVDLTAFHQKEKEAVAHFAHLKLSERDFQPHIKVGLLTSQINLAAQELKADLVIMGTKGATGWLERISGSEAQHVARYLDNPVLTIRAGASVNELKNILLVADFELFGKGEQIDLIKSIADAFDSTIHLLQILKKEDEPYKDQVQYKMDFFAEKHQLTRFETHLYRNHKVEDGVKNFSNEAQIDLVCIRTHARKGINHLLFGSIAERLINHCIKPLLTFHIK
jgi:nucleotide-binding universal stress UspA family protein